MSILNHFFDYKPEVLALDEKAMELCQPYFRQMEEIRDFNQLKMLKAFADTQMSSTDMLGTTGYGLWDTGRAKLEQIFAQVMGAEDALVRSQFQSGTHTLAVALFGLLRAGDTLLAATGRPYDTLEGVIGLDGKGKGTGTLMDYGIQYDEAPLKADFTPDYDLIAQKAPGAKVCHIQRSRGYLQRNAFDLDTIRKVADTARAVFAVEAYEQFIRAQAESALRHVATTHPYDEPGPARPRCAAARTSSPPSWRPRSRPGWRWPAWRSSRFASPRWPTPPRLAQAMLQRQQASAIIDARKMIVDGAVGMVEMALDRLSENKVVELDDERKAAMVSNLLVVLCGNRDAQPIVNSGSLY